MAFIDQVYKNSNKGTRYTNQDLESAFGTSNVEECMKQIVMKGEIQLTTQDRKRKIDEKHRQIVNFIHKYYVNPKTKQPHPITHIENALKQVKYKTSLKQTTQKQVDNVIKMFPGILSCHKTIMEGTIGIPNQYIGQSLGIVKEMCSIIKQSYTNTMCNMFISIIPGNYDTLTAKLNTITKGEFTFTIEGDNTTKNTKTEKKTQNRGKKGKKKKSQKHNKYQYE